MASDACTDVISDPIEGLLGPQNYPKAGSSKAEKRANEAGQGFSGVVVGLRSKNSTGPQYAMSSQS